MKFTMTLAILLLFSQLEAQVLHVGSMDEMGKNGFQPTVSIDSLLQDKNTLYGMGPYGFMQGEITIVKGQPFVAYADENGQLIVRKDPKAKAPFFVYAYVRDWKEFEINAEIIDQKSLEMAIRELAQKQGFDTSTPFPFRIVTEMEELAIHVVAPRSSNIPGFKEGVNSVKYVFNKISGEILGFYSEQSQGIYTAKDSNIHLHFISSDQSKMGHVNHIRISEKQKTKVLLPFSPMQGDKLSFNTIDTDFSKGRLTNEQNITISDLEKFHGHLCDGLVVGALAMQQAMTVLYPNQPIDRTNLRIVSKPSPCLYSKVKASKIVQFLNFMQHTSRCPHMGFPCLQRQIFLRLVYFLQY
ncbi:acetolactate decarboxylase [Rhodonellum psychrophilum]|nr:acetolactate decarboxylase [Rhodonellum psychrophilum]